MPDLTRDTVRENANQIGLDFPRSSRDRKHASPRAESVSLAVAGLFAGIGGIELGFNRAGHRTKLLCEIDQPAVAVLKRRFPGIPIHQDIRSLDKLPAECDLISAGFPCQDLSQAGKTAGISGANSGLIYSVFELLRKRSVEWVVLENVPFLLQIGRGKSLEVILSEFERLGYSWAYRVIDSRAFGLPQRRRRVYFVASKNNDPREVLFADEMGPPPPDNNDRDMACGFYWTEGTRGLGWAENAIPTLKGGSTVGIPSPPAILMPDGSIIKPSLRDAERLQGFPSDWTKPAETVARPSLRWKLVGNAVSVTAAKWLGTKLARPGIPQHDGSRVIRRNRPWPNAAFNVGEGRFEASISEWPKNYKHRELRDFLIDGGDLLSERATSGFLSRAENSKLVFPNGFLDSVRRHLRNVQRL